MTPVWNFRIPFRSLPSSLFACQFPKSNQGRRFISSTTASSSNPSTTTPTVTNTKWPPSSPLKILFCGSDPFSIASLTALHAESNTDSSLISSLEIITRPPKRTGRGLKTITTVPLTSFTRDELDLPVHEIDTFTGWTPPRPYDLVLTVSFGLLVPERILKAARYGGLNVHPSLLPDLRGAAPLQWTLLKGRTGTGVSVQTMHPKVFDRGVVVARRKVEVPKEGECTVEELRGAVEGVAGEMLVGVLREGSFVGVGVEGSGGEGGEGVVENAPKITKEDSRVRWKSWGCDELMRRLRVLGQVWEDVEWMATAKETSKRIMYHELKDVSELYFSQASERAETKEPGNLFLWSPDGAAQNPLLLAFTCDTPPRVVQVAQTTVSGGQKGHGNKDITRFLRRRDKERIPC
ncbi:Formyltransferase [Aulographum hederae CBS 113979]|uniref:methionyl-tRNA formyltransferase n=1 Tax=Aulographum hederae CBS 113979 TaxID=1176131 RepID=A0A6G1H081_9PEZI|nr:Formyltransferase [Aulographum hederae CBS 113979]